MVARFTPISYQSGDHQIERLPGISERQPYQRSNSGSDGPGTVARLRGRTASARFGIADVVIAGPRTSTRQLRYKLCGTHFELPRRYSMGLSDQAKHRSYSIAAGGERTAQFMGLDCIVSAGHLALLFLNQWTVGAVRL